MAEFLANWAQAIGKIVLESAPYVMFGLYIAGLIQMFLSADRVTRHLGGNDLRSVMMATLVGAPLPLCSCSVVPAAVELRRKGASKGATTAFLISTPETGVDSIGITYALLDPIMTVMRPLAAIVTSISAGSVVNLMVRLKWVPASESEDASARSTQADACCAPTPDAAATVTQPEHEAHHDHGHEHAHHDHDHTHVSPGSNASLPSKFIGAGRYAFGPLLADLTPWFLLGFVISGLIEVVVPPDFFGTVVPHGIWAILLMLVIGAPMYICATASTPVAAALIAKGLEPGAALVLMLAGPATSIGSMFIVSSLLGRVVFVTYVLTIALCAVVFGLAVNEIYLIRDVDLGRIVREGGAADLGWGSVLAAIVFGAALLIHAWRQNALATFEDKLASWGALPSRRFLRYALAFLLIGTWCLSGLSVAGPGETGFVTRFGKVVETIRGPGYSVHLPYPIDRFETVATGLVDRVVVGGEESAPQEIGGMVLPMDAESSSDQIECVTGDEKLLLVSYTVHYHALDAYEWRFAIRDVPALVTASSQAAIRRMVGRRSMDEHLIERREPLEHETRGYLQESLSQVSSGIEVLDVNLEYIHAPSQVHFAYRDVASSLEDKQTAVKNGEAYEKEWLAQTRGEAEKMVEKAEGERTAKVAQANGAVAAFLALSKVAAEDAASQVRVRDQLLLRSQLRAWIKPALTALLAKNVQVIGSSASERSPERAAEAEDR